MGMYVSVVLDGLRRCGSKLEDNQFELHLPKPFVFVLYFFLGVGVGVVVGVGLAAGGLCERTSFTRRNTGPTYIRRSQVWV